MRIRTAFVNALLVTALWAQSVSGHAWMMDPVPRSGGGVGSGNASTLSPCGHQAGFIPSGTTWVADTNVTVTYKRANAGGATGPTVTFRMNVDVGGSINPSNSDFTALNSVLLADNVVLDTSSSLPQEHTFFFPDLGVANNTMAVLQFHHRPTSGGNWYDCAWVNLAYPPPPPPPPSPPPPNLLGFYSQKCPNFFPPHPHHIPHSITITNPPPPSPQDHC